MNIRLTEADYAAIQARRAQHVADNRVARVRKQSADAVVSDADCDARHAAILALRGADIDAIHRRRKNGASKKCQASIQR